MHRFSSCSNGCIFIACHAIKAYRYFLLGWLIATQSSCLSARQATIDEWPVGWLVGKLEEETRRCLHLPVGLRTSDLAKAGRRGESCRGSCLGYRESAAGRLEIGVVDDVEGIHTKLESQAFMNLEVLGDRGIEIHFTGCPVGVSRFS